jgi:hypothetical protein
VHGLHISTRWSAPQLHVLHPAPTWIPASHRSGAVRSFPAIPPYQSKLQPTLKYLTIAGLTLPPFFNLAYTMHPALVHSQPTSMLYTPRTSCAQPNPVNAQLIDYLILFNTHGYAPCFSPSM